MGSIAAVFQTHCASGVAVVVPQPALADTADASCEVRKDGDKFVRTQSGGSFQAFKWEHGKHIKVTLNAPAYNHNKHHQSGNSQQGGYRQDGAGSEHP